MTIYETVSSIEESFLGELADLDIETSVDLVNEIIRMHSDKFPVSKDKGRMNYRDFYKADALKMIYDEYKKFK